MRHEELTELVSAYANDEVSQLQRDFIETHLATCPECQEKLAGFRQVRKQLKSLQFAQATQGIRERTMTAIKSEPLRGRTAPGWLRPAFAALSVFAIAAVLATVYLTGGSGQSPIAHAHDVLADIKSYRMTGTTVITSNGQSSESTFEWTFSNNGDATGTINSEGSAVQFVIVDGEQYSRSPAGTNGVAVVTDDPLTPMPNRSNTLGYLERLSNVKEHDPETIDGVAVRHFTGTIDVGALFDAQLAGLDQLSEEYRQAKAWADIQRQATIDVDLWLGKSDSRIKRLGLDIHSPIAGSSNGSDVQLLGWLTYSTTADFSNFNEPVQIDRPVDDSGTLLPGWNMAGGSLASPDVTAGN